jgi:hypothetical protein
MIFIAIDFLLHIIIDIDAAFDYNNRLALPH